MHKVLLPLLILLFSVTPTYSQTDLKVLLETDPPAGKIGPDETLAKTTLRVVDANGQAVPNAYLKLHLDAPPGNSVISTDFPVVEGTPLLNYEGALPNGVLEFDYIYPIRGVYNFEVEAGPAPTALTFQDTLTLSLNENRNELINFGVMLLILLGLGMVAGFFIGRGARAQRLAAAAVVLLLSLGLVGGSISSVQAHGGDTPSSEAPFTESVSTANQTLTYAMNPGGGRVGTLSNLAFTATAANGNPVADTTFTVAMWHIEDDKPVFATTLNAPAGQTHLAFQFFDGAEHEVRVTAKNSLGTVELAKVVAVEGVSPPLPVKLKTTVYLLLLVFIGILIGLQIQLKRAKRSQLTPVTA